MNHRDWIIEITNKHFKEMARIKMRMSMEEWAKLTQEEKDKLIDEYMNAIESSPLKYNIETKSYQDKETLDKFNLDEIEEIAKTDEERDRIEDLK